MTINPQRAQALFLAALEMPESQDRDRFLDRECGPDDVLRRRVEALLSAHEATGGFDLAPSGAAIGATVDAASIAIAGSLLAGRYKLIEAIGEGGMGSVWVAEQKEPVRRKVAIKLIKAGMDSKSVLARFEAERQALAMMDHPNIAKVFDGGMTDQGRPFFVMEYVKGVPLTEYCDQARLSLKERLNLFMPVCQAVQHAHQKGIIHRDLKPSNILVCLYDGKPVPKVIDFGLAKAMHQSLTEHSLHTAHGMMVGTPLYMSPEQAEHNNLDVDTRTDIYSLGVILYELLTGSTPLERQQMKVAAFNEILRLIKDVEPPKPSTRLSSSQNLPSIAAQRSIEPAQLKKSLIGELDWIVMKALDKERSRRYETANGFARDVERFLHDETVEAGPVSALYRMRKFAKRYKTGLALSFAVLLITSSSAIVSTYWGLEANWRRWEAMENLREANAQRDFAKEAQAETVRQRDAARGSRQRSRAALDEISSEVVQEWLTGLPEYTQKQRDFLKRIATHYQQIAVGEEVDSENNQHFAEGYLRVAQIYSLLGDTAIVQQYVADSIKHFQELIEREPQNVELRMQHVSALRLQFKTDSKSMNGEKSDQFAEEALRGADRLVADFPGNDECRLLWSMTTIDYALYLAYSKRGQQGLSALDRVAADTARLKDLFPDIKRYRRQYCVYLTNRYVVLDRLQRRDEALRGRLEAMQEADRLASDFPEDVEIQNSAARNHTNYGIWLAGSEKFVQADMEFSIANDLQSQLCLRFPSSSLYLTSLGKTQICWSDSKLKSGQTDEAIDIANRAVATWGKLTSRSPDLGNVGGLASARACVARAELQNGNAERSVLILDEALRENQRVVDSDARNRFALDDKHRMHMSRAAALRVLKRFEQAAEEMRAAIKAAELINQRVAEDFVLLTGDLAMSGKAAEVRELAQSITTEMDEVLSKKYLLQLARFACIASKYAEEIDKRALEKIAVDALVRLNELKVSLDQETFTSSDFDPIRNDPKIFAVLK